MRTLQHFSNRRERDQSAAVAAFLAGLPDLRRGRIVTESSDVDSWRRKSPAIERRLAGDRAQAVRP